MVSRSHRKHLTVSPLLLLAAAVTVSSLLFLLLFLFFPSTTHFHSRPPHRHDPLVCDRSLYSPQWQLTADQITVLISGYSPSRIPLLKTHARIYSAAPCVHSVLILWFSSNHTELNSDEFESMGAPILIIPQTTSSLNARFLPRTQITTRSVLIADDDIQIDPKAVCFALKVWTGHSPPRLAGFFPRSHAYDLSSRRWIYTVHPDRFSIVLTKLMVVPTELLYVYSCDMPRGVREFVERHRNCEDIAMNFLAADRARLGPVLVRGQPRDWGDTRNEGLRNGSVVAISGVGGHRAFRGRCIEEFHRIWGRMPLRYSYGVVVDDVREQAICSKHGGALVPCDREA